MDPLIEALFQAVLSEEDKPLSVRHRQVKDRILEAEGAVRSWTKPKLSAAPVLGGSHSNATETAASPASPCAREIGFPGWGKFCRVIFDKMQGGPA
jgi:hypothetical protein